MEQKRKFQDRNKQKRGSQYERVECSTDRKPNQACEWVILGEKAVHYVLDLFISISTLQKFSPDVKQWTYSEVNGIAALMPEVNLARKGLSYAMI